MLNQPSFILIDSLEKERLSRQEKETPWVHLYRIMAPFWDKTYGQETLKESRPILLRIMHFQS